MFGLMEKAWFRGVSMACCLVTLAPFLRGQTMAVEMANLREDVRLLAQRVGELQLKIEQLETQNGELSRRAQGAAQNYATVTQLNDAIADLNRVIKQSASTTKNETLQQVSTQMEKLAKQSNAAIESLAKAVNSARAASASPVSAPVSPPSFSDDYPKEGITYTVQKGDSLGSIAKKTGGAPKDIINANKLADPSKIHVGQTLFIPGGK
jgi:LysM repeat protein